MARGGKLGLFAGQCFARCLIFIRAKIQFAASPQKIGLVLLLLALPLLLFELQLGMCGLRLAASRFDSLPFGLQSLGRGFEFGLRLAQLFLPALQLQTTRGRVALIDVQFGQLGIEPFVFESQAIFAFAEELVVAIQLGADWSNCV